MQTNSLILTDAKSETKVRRNPRGVFEKVPDSGEWWIRYNDSDGRYRQEKAGSKSVSIKLADKRRTEALQGKKLPERLRRATVSSGEIAKYALAYSRANKLSYRQDAGRMGQDVSFTRRTLTIQRSKIGATRHVPLNQAALRTLEILRSGANGSEFVCGGLNTSRRWLEPAV